MKITTLTAMMIAATGSAPCARFNATAVAYTVVVCSDALVGPEYALVHSTSSAIFAKIGIKLVWHDANRCPPGALIINLSTATPESLKPGSLGYALPYEGTHIVVFLDRVRTIVEPRKVPVLLAHVYAHEITHILQGISRHSESGLMKAHWCDGDYDAMAWRSLPFTSEDVDLIYAGMAHRAAAARSQEYHGETERF
jgi:hypothetical protein